MTAVNESAIAELRRLSGLSWDQLACLFGVSRRSLHFWASGKMVSPGHREHLQRLLGTLRKIDRGSSEENRAALLNPRDDGEIPFDGLVSGQYEHVVAILGRGAGRSVVTKTPTAEVIEERLPPPPKELVNALQDRIHPSSGRLRASKPVSVRRRLV